MAKVLKTSVFDFFTEASNSHWSSDVHAVRHTGIDVKTDSGDIRINNSDIRSSLGVLRVSAKLLGEICVFLLEKKFIDPKNPLDGFKR